MLDLSGVKVLVVDDDSMNRKLLKSIISKLNAEIIEAENGEEALAKIIEEGDISLVFLDLVMPVMDGQTFLHKLAEKGYDIPVIVVSTDDTNAKKSVGQGAMDFIVKPINKTKIISLLEKWLVM